jgi:hypothetical protein
MGGLLTWTTGQSRPGGIVMILLVAALFAMPAYANILILDTFDEKGEKNALQNLAAAWGDPSDPSAGCKVSFDTENRLTDQGYSLRLDYDVESDRERVHVPTNASIPNPPQIRNDVYNGYFSLLGSMDLTPYRYLHLWVKGDRKRGYTKTFRIELKDHMGTSPVDVQGVTHKWQEIVIALDRFKEIRDWTRIKEFVVVFGPDFVTRKVGTVYLDDIYFSAEADDKIRLPRKELSAKKLDAVSVDGKLTEWPQRAFVTLSRAQGNLESGKISSPSDLSAWFAVGWDNEHLYIAVDVQDNESLNRQAPQDLWKDDAVEIYVDPQNDGLTWNDPQDFQLGLSPVSADNRPESWAFFQKRKPREEEMKSAIRRYRDGYQMEIALAWSFLGADSRTGVGFTLAVHDRDTADDSEEAKLNWSFQPVGDTRIQLGKLEFE